MRLLREMRLEVQMNKGLRFYVVVWQMDITNGTMTTTIEAAHSRRYLVDQIKRGEINEGRRRYVKIQEIETPLIEMEYLQNLFSGLTSKKDSKAHKAQNVYVLELVRQAAARVMLENGEVIER